MTKRFSVDDGLEDVLCWEINDKENENMTCGECAKLLNKLSDENEQLKEFIKELISNDGKIWLMNGYVYKTDKILKGDVE